MRGFVILFEEKEGTSAVVRLLDNFDHVTALHLDGAIGWEPFDRHTCGPMSTRALRQCLDILFGEGDVDTDRLNRVYQKTAEHPIAPIPRGDAVGFKMRFVPPLQTHESYPGVVTRIVPRRLLDRLHYRTFHRTMLDTLRKHNVVVFLAVRQDVFRWGLSTYHGDGTGQPGHLQFKLAAGEIDRDDIPPIHVDCDRLDTIIAGLEAQHAKKRALQKSLREHGIDTYPLLYEAFCDRPHDFFRELLLRLGYEASAEEIQRVLDQGIRLEKVHSGPVSDFVLNAEEVERRFGARFVAWR